MVMLMVEVLFFGMICEATPANRKDRSGQGGAVLVSLRIWMYAVDDGEFLVYRVRRGE